MILFELLLGLQFGPDVTERFLKLNNLEYVVRSHEVKQEGYELAHNGIEYIYKNIYINDFRFFFSQENVLPYFRHQIIVIPWEIKVLI